MSRHVAWKLDLILLRASRGRLSTTLTIPSALLETRGTKTALPRRNTVIYFHDGGRVVIVASNAGGSRHPAWYHNLRAHPDVTFGGVHMQAAVVEGEAERERLWGLADRVFPTLRPTAGRQKPRTAGSRSYPSLRVHRKRPPASTLGMARRYRVPMEVNP